MLVGVPTNVTIEADNGKVKLLSWDLVNGAQSYQVEWFSDPDPNVLSAAASPVTHASLTEGLRYRYSVTAGAQQTVLSAVPVPADSTAPSTVSITSGPTDNTISWSPVAGATAYRVYWSYLPNVTPANGTRIDVDGGQTVYTHTDLEPQTHYYYVIAAMLSPNTQGAPSGEVGAEPGLTTAVTATVSQARVDLSWSGSLSDIQVATHQMFGVGFFPGFPISITGLENDRRYSFVVWTVVDGERGAPSANVYATPKAAPNGVPGTVTLTAGRGVNTLSWEPVAGAATYDVSWTAIDGDGRLIAGSRTVDEPEFRHSALNTCVTAGPACLTYAYRVRVSPSGQFGPLVEAFSINLYAAPPLVINTNTLLLVGTKPRGTRVVINGEQAVPLDSFTSWRSNTSFTDRDGVYVVRLVAVDEDELESLATTFEVTVDTTPPSAPAAITIVRCDPLTGSRRRVTLQGSKEAGSAVFRAMEPDAPDQQIVGATTAVAWSGFLDVDNQTDVISVIAKDAAGNGSVVPVTVDLADPDNGCP